MTKKDFNTLVKISIPKPEGDYTVFFITLGICLFLFYLVFR